MEPFDLGAVRRALHDWLHAQTGLRVIWSNQNAPEPRLPYATLTVVSGPRAIAPLDEILMTSVASEHVLTARGPRTLTVSCQTYARPYEDGKTAIDYLLRAQASLRLPSVRAELAEAGLAVMEDLGISEIPDVVRKRWCSRAYMDMRLALTSQISEPVDVIEDVTLSGGPIE